MRAADVHILNSEILTNRNPEEEKLQEFAALDVLRFVLASVVMLGHSGAIPWTQSANLAVQVFFALSGWLIGGILYSTANRELSRFYYNRSTRVWIPYFFTVLALYLISLLHEPVRSSRWIEFLAYDVTFTHNWFTLPPDPLLASQQMPLHGTGNHFWSLAVEEQFYLFAPLIITVMPFGRKILPWLGIAALAYFSRSEYSAICLGVLSAVIARNYGNWYFSNIGRVALMLTLIVAAMAMISPSAYMYAAPVLAISVVLLCASPLRRNSVTKWLGGISYPFYLNAWIGIFAMHAVEKHFALRPSWYTLPAEFLAGLAVAALSYAIIDSRVMARRNRYYKPSVGWTLGAAGYLLIVSGIVVRIVYRGLG